MSNFTFTFIPKASYIVHACVLRHFSMPNSLWPCGLYPAWLLCPWDSTSRNTGVGSVSSRGSSWPKDRICTSLALQVDSFTHWATWEAHIVLHIISKMCKRLSDHSDHGALIFKIFNSFIQDIHTKTWLCVSFWALMSAIVSQTF